jgi:hypothetical protein
MTLIGPDGSRQHHAARRARSQPRSRRQRQPSRVKASIAQKRLRAVALGVVSPEVDLQPLPFILG